MDKKGFTLIELLAIVVIMGLILIIALPTFNGAIEDSSKNIAYENANRLVKSFQEYYVRMRIKNDFQGCSYIFDSDDNTCLDYSFDGKKPTGSVSVSVDGNINGFIVFNGYSFSISNGEISYVEGD